MIYISYCRDILHIGKPVVAVGDNPNCNAVSHGVHTDIGHLEKPNEDVHALLAAHDTANAVFAHLEATYGTEMI